MRLQQYLRLMGTLYFQGAVSDFHPGLLARHGGSLVMCARDVEHIRIDPDSILGMERRIEDRHTAARIGWRRHAARIRALLDEGTTPTRAIYSYCRSFGTSPHAPRQLEQALTRVMRSDGGQSPAWMIPILEMRARVGRGSAVMSDTFGAITTLGALMMTAEDWQRATPEEWDRALNAGEVGVLIGEMAGAHADARGARLDAIGASRDAHAADSHASRRTSSSR